jgi:hypothetical protein
MSAGPGAVPGPSPTARLVARLRGRRSARSVRSSRAGGGRSPPSRR